MNKAWTFIRTREKHLIIMLLLLAILPFFGSTYIVSIVTLAMIYAIFAISLDLAWGYAGILSLGHAIFFGIGAYTYSVFTMDGGSLLSVIGGVSFGIVFAALAAAAISTVVFYKQSSELFVGVVTLALTVLASQLVLRIPKITGGMNGLSGFAAFSMPAFTLHFVLLACLTLVILVMYRVTTSDFGKLVIGTRDNEERSKFLGYNTALTKTAVYCLSGAVAGLAGVLYAPVSGFVTPDLIGFTLSTSVVIWVAIGGRGHIAGALLGALLINVLTPVFNYSYPYLWQIFIGVLFIVVVVFAPEGIYAFLLRRRAAAREYLLEPVVADREPTGGTKVPLVIQDLHVSYGNVAILKGVNLEIRPSELQCVIGPNGAGKSTLINAITGKIRSTRGSIRYGGQELRGKKPQDIVKLKVGRKFQSTNVFGNLTVAENLQLARSKGVSPTAFKSSAVIEIPPSVAGLLKFSRLDQKISEPASNLSHGEQQWLEICMVMALEPSILLLDEPTAGLTKEERREVGLVLKSMVADMGVGILIIEHDIEFVKEIADRITVLYNGKIAADGTVEEITNSAIVKDIYLGAKAA